MITRINLDATKINSQVRKDKLTRVAQELHTVINSRIFMDAIIKMKPMKGELSIWKDATNMSIYKHIMSGAETLDPVEDYELDIYVDDYYSLKWVIGYTRPSIKTIYINSRYFDKRTTKLIGSNILHEQGDKLGFKHAFRKPSRSCICYQLNDIYETCYDRIFGKGQANKVKVCYRPWKFLKLKKVCYWKEIYD